MNIYYKINAPITYIDTYTKEGAKLLNSQRITVESKDGTLTTKFNLRYATTSDGKLVVSIDADRKHPIWNKTEKKEYACFGKHLKDYFDLIEFVPEKKPMLNDKGAANEKELLPSK